MIDKTPFILKFKKGFEEKYNQSISYELAEEYFERLFVFYSIALEYFSKIDKVE